MGARWETHVGPEHTIRAFPLQYGLFLRVTLKCQISSLFGNKVVDAFVPLAGWHLVLRMRGEREVQADDPALMIISLLFGRNFAARFQQWTWRGTHIHSPCSSIV